MTTARRNIALGAFLACLAVACRDPQAIEPMGFTCVLLFCIMFGGLIGLGVGVAIGTLHHHLTRERQSAAEQLYVGTYDAAPSLTVVRRLYGIGVPRPND